MKGSKVADEMRLEVVMLPVTDVDASLRFYRDQVGFQLDHDLRPVESMRVVQLTPPGSACSIVFGEGMGPLAGPGSVRNTHLVVSDIEATRARMIERGVDVSEIQDMGGIWYAYFADADGNSWALQQVGGAQVG